MKILVLTNSISKKNGGVLDAVKDLFQNDAFIKHQVEIEICSYNDEYSDEDIRLWNIVKPKLFKPSIFLYSRKLRRHVLESDADILHLEGLWRYPHLLIDSWIRKTGKPALCTPHGMLDPYIVKSQGSVKRIIADWFFDSHLRNLSCLNALNEKEYEDIRTYGLKNPVAIIPNGIYLPSSEIKKEIKDGKRHLLFLGRVHRKKGVDLLIQAVINIVRKNNGLMDNWVVDIVGWDHENCMAELKTMVEKSQLTDRIIFHGGLFGEEKKRILSNSDVFILPSHGEGHPMSVLEAWSYKLPVIITDHCNTPEGFEANAAIHIDDNVASVEDGITKVLKMPPSELKQLGENGFKLVSEKFTWNQSALKMIELYNWLLGKAEVPDFVRFD